MQVTITYDPDTETLSVDPTAYAGTTADNDTSELIIEGLVGELMDWTADLVFPIVSFSSSCNSFYPMARLDQTRIYSLPNTLLSLCRDGILPVQLRLTKDERIKWSRNTVRIDVSKIVDAVGAIGDAFPLQAYLKGDTASWSRSIVYEEGAIVERDGYLYRSTDSNNLGNDPETPGSTWWSPIDVAAPYYSGLFGDGEQTAIDVRHKLNTEELAWSVYLDGSYTEDVIVTVIDADNVRFSFDHAPSYNSVHVVIMPAFRVVGHGIRIKGPLTVEGDITNMGGAHIIYTDEMHTKKAMIYLREDATVGLLPEELSGLRFVRYDGTHDGILAVDSHGTAYVGDEGDLQPIATRADADEMTDDLPVVWDSSGSKMVTRELVAGDIPDLDAGKIISGTIADERIPSGITRDTELTAHTSRTDNPHAVTKAQVGLGNVDNTSDANKPISTATQSALDAKQPNLTGGATTIASANLTPSRALISNSSGKVAVSPVTATELGYVDGVTSPIQSQIDTKVTKTGAESIGGVKTFTDNVNVGLVGTPKQLSLVGDLNIQGNITQNGTAYEVHAEQIHTKDDKIIMRDGATAGLLAGDSSGFTFKKYNGTNDGELSVDSSGTARVGDVGDLQPLATRDESEAMGDGLPVVWDADNLKMITKALAPGDIPELDASKITSGTIADARIPAGITRDTELSAHTSLVNNPHSVTKAQVGLSNVDNTSDANKPVSTATNTELAKKVAIAQGSGNASKFALTDASGDLNTFRTLTATDIPDLNASKITAGTLADARIPTTIARSSEVTAHTGRTDNPHSVTKAQVGLGSVDNTSDINKPISTATQTALDGKADASALDGYVPTTRKVNGKSLTADVTLTAADVGALSADTYIPEGSVVDPDFSETSVNPIQNKVLTTRLNTLATKAELEAHTSNTSNPHGVTKADVGLGNVNNTSDLDKPVSTAQAQAIGQKADASALTGHTGNTSNPHSVTKAQVGLGAYPTNPSDIGISTATQTALNGKQATLTFDSTPKSSSTNPVTSGGVKTALDAKQATITGGATTIATSNLTASRALASDASGKVAVSAVTSTELCYLAGVTSAVQTQLNAKQATLSFDSTPIDSSTNPVTSGGVKTALDAKQDTITGAASTITEYPLFAKRVLVSNASGKVTSSSITSIELDRLSGVTSNIQPQLDGKVSKTGNESIAGIKTFSDNVEIGTTLVPKQLSINGNLLIDGNITQNGSTYETHAQQVYTTDDKIIMRDGATGGLLAGDTSGLTFKKYDGTNDGELSVDSTGTARVGDVGDLQPLATRSEAELMTDDLPVVWDATDTRMVTRQLTKSDVGLSAYPVQPSDLPVSSATQTALDGKMGRIYSISALTLATGTWYPISHMTFINAMYNGPHLTVAIRDDNTQAQVVVAKMDGGTYQTCSFFVPGGFSWTVAGDVSSTSVDIVFTSV